MGIGPRALRRAVLGAATAGEAWATDDSAGDAATAFHDFAAAFDAGVPWRDDTAEDRRAFHRPDAQVSPIVKTVLDADGRVVSVEVLRAGD